MGEPTDDNGWGLPSAAFWRSLCPPPLPPPWPPQRPDLIPPWQDPAERQRAAQAAVEAERVRAEEEETLQFIRDYVQALRDWRKEIVFHWGDHVIGRTTITLFKNQSAGDEGQSSSAQPAAGDAGTLTAELARSNPIKLNPPSAAAPSAGAIERPEQTAATVESPGTSPNGGPGLVEDDPALAGTNSGASDIAIEPAEPVIVSSEGPALLTRFGPGNQTMTDMAPDDGSLEQLVVTAPRPAAPEERPVTAPSGPSASSGFPFNLISSAQAQEVPETETDPALEEEVTRNEEVFQAREIALEREALAQRADLPTGKGNAEIKAAAANVSNPLEPFLTPRNPALDALAARVRRAQTNPAMASVRAHREGASGTPPAGNPIATLGNGWSVTSPRGLGVSTGPLPPGYTTVSRWVSPNEAAAWIDNGGTAIPADIGAGGRVYVTTLKAPQPGGTGPIRIDFAVPERTLNVAGNAEWFQIFQPVQSTPIYNVQIFVPPGIIILREKYDGN